MGKHSKAQETAGETASETAGEISPALRFNIRTQTPSKRKAAGKSGAAGRQEAADWQDAAGWQDAASQKDTAGRQEAVGQRDAASQKDAINQREVAGRREAVRKKEAARKNRLVSRLLLILGIALLAAAAVIAWLVIWGDGGYAQSQSFYQDMRVTGRAPQLDITPPDRVSEDTTLADLNYDWAALQEVNPNIIAWVVVPGTNINYPVVQGSNNSYYLTHRADDAYSNSGAIFADADGSRSLNALNNIIYGHNMFDGSMFSDLIMYTSQDYFDRHRTVYLCTPVMNYELSAAGAIRIRYDAPLRRFGFESQSDYSSYLQTTLASPEAAAPDLAEILSQTQQFYSLVTCQTLDASTRVVLCCTLVKSVAPEGGGN